LILVTGGAGFIGSNFILQWLAAQGEPVVNFDKLTYAGNLRNLDSVRGDARHIFVQGDIDDARQAALLLRQHQPRAVLNFAAESHVDRSILGPAEFVRTNIHGTFTMLEAARAFWNELQGEAKQSFRFLQISTDEVYGSLGPGDAPFRETTAYAPNSPYAASKAAADHMVRAYYHTYGLPTLTTNCSNNYGPFQFPEKLIPLVILNAIAGKPIPVYGDGLNVRDWIYVDDHCSGIRRVLEAGQPGEVYNIGGNSEMNNLEVVQTLCAVLDELRPAPKPYASLIAYVKDRPGHDRRYAIDAGKIRRELGWQAAGNFAGGMRRTVSWYLAHADWTRSVTSGEYQKWVSANYQERGAA
jgi:dTDP-glucose 4,6-dehydratase